MQSKSGLVTTNRETLIKVIKPEDKRFYADIPHRQYEEDEILPLPIGPETRRFLIEFNDPALLNEVMPYLADREDVAIDDDHGNVAPGTDFVRAVLTSAALSWLPADYET